MRRPRRQARPTVDTVRHRLALCGRRRCAATAWLRPHDREDRSYRVEIPAHAAAAAPIPAGHQAEPQPATPLRRTAQDFRSWLRRFGSTFDRMVRNTGSKSPGELEMTLSTSEVAACCSSASLSFFQITSVRLELLYQCCLGPDAPTRVLAFVPVERSLRPPVRLFAPLRAQGHLVGTVSPCRSGPNQGWSMSPIAQ